MSLDMWTVAIDEQLPQIANDLFSTLIDGEEGYLYPILDAPTLSSPRSAWVDITHDDSHPSMRVSITLDQDAYPVLAAAMLRMDDPQSVGPVDVDDAIGEVVNIIGGNVKSLLDHTGTLTLPALGSFGAPGTILTDLCFHWRGYPLFLTVWTLPDTPNHITTERTTP